MQRDLGIGKRICHECGKEIYFPDFNRWCYKLQAGNRYVKYFCSYTCLQKGKEKAHQEKLAKQKKYREMQKQRREAQ